MYVQTYYFTQKSKKMREIGIIGSGQVGQSLATGFIKHGFEVMIGTRNKSNLEN